MYFVAVASISFQEVIESGRNVCLLLFTFRLCIKLYFSACFIFKQKNLLLLFFFLHADCRRLWHGTRQSDSLPSKVTASPLKGTSRVPHYFLLARPNTTSNSYSSVQTFSEDWLKEMYFAPFPLKTTASRHSNAFF